MNFLNRFFRMREHLHVISVDDMAIGEPDMGIPITAFRWRCKLCGQIFDVPTESGLKQVREGRNAFHWLNYQPVNLHKEEQENE